MAQRLLQLRFDAMQAMPCTMEGDETVQAMDATAAKLELAALSRLRAQCDDSFAIIIQNEHAGAMAQFQAERLNELMEASYRRGEAALQRHLDGLATEPAAGQAAMDNTAQLLQIVRKR